jgi:hypothetical protein
MEVNTKPLEIGHINGTNFSSKLNRLVFLPLRAFDVDLNFFDKKRKRKRKIFCFQLLDMIFRNATLFQVTQSVTRNGKSIMLTMMLALILIYLFSVLGFVFFRDDFLTHIETRLFSSYSHHRYRRTNTLLKTTTLTRMSSCRHTCFYVSYHFKNTNLWSSLLFFSYNHSKHC